MRLTLPAAALRDALLLVEGALPTKHPTVVGRAAVIVAKHGEVEVRGGSRVAYARARTPAQVEETGTAAVDMDRLRALLLACEETMPVTLTLTGGRLVVTHMRAVVRLVTCSPEQASTLDTLPSGAPAGWTLLAEDWGEVLKRTIPFAATSVAVSPSGSPFLGLSVTPLSDALQVVASDSQRLALWVAKSPGTRAPSASILLPADPLQRLGDIWSPFRSVTLTLHPDSPLLTIEASDPIRRPGDGLTVTLSILPGTFPAVGPLLVPPTTTVTVPRVGLLSALQGVRALVGPVPSVVIETDGVQVTLNTGPSENSGAMVLEDAQVEGGPQALAVNVHLLRAGLRLLKEPSVTLGFTEKGRPLQVAPSGPDFAAEGRMLFMPMKIESI